MQIKKAMILAAGLGTRLRPVTNYIPKPLMRVGGEPLIERNLNLLKKAGVKEVVINLHHLGGMIKKHVGDGRRFGLKIRYLSEPKILGTGGGIKNAGKFLKGGPFFVMNADVVIDLDLKKASRRFFDRGNAAALMVLRRIKPREDFARISIDKKGRVRRFGSGRYMFTGVQVLSPVVLGFLKKPSCLIKDGYKKMIKKGLNVYSLIHKGYWNDVGTFERYFEANDSMSCPMLDQGQSEVRI